MLQRRKFIFLSPHRPKSKLTKTVLFIIPGLDKSDEFGTHLVFQKVGSTYLNESLPQYLCYSILTSENNNSYKTDVC